MVYERIADTGETVWYELMAGHGIPGLVALTYRHKMTVSTRGCATSIGPD